MLRELLALLAEGNTFSQFDFAERLRVSPEAIAARLDFLHHMGYIQQICPVKNCGKKCAICHTEEIPQNGVILWEVSVRSKTSR